MERDSRAKLNATDNWDQFAKLRGELLASLLQRCAAGLVLALGTCVSLVWVW